MNVGELNKLLEKYDDDTEICLSNQTDDTDDYVRAIIIYEVTTFFDPYAGIFKQWWPAHYSRGVERMVPLDRDTQTILTIAPEHDRPKKAA